MGPKVQESEDSKCRGTKTKLLAETREPAEASPVVYGPVEDRAPLAAVPAETDDAAEAERVAPDLAECDNRKIPLHFREGGPEREQLGRVRGAKAPAIELGECAVDRDVAVQVDQFYLDLFVAGSVLREVAIVDVAVLPAILAGRDQVVDGRRSICLLYTSPSPRD